MSLIDRVSYVKNGDLNINSLRRATTIMDGKNNEFKPGEIRLLLVDQESSFGGHWREYDEVWGFLGNATVTLEDIDTKERKIYKVADGTRLFIPSRVASKIEAEKSTAIVTCSSYNIDREKQTHKYEFN